MQRRLPAPGSSRAPPAVDSGVDVAAACGSRRRPVSGRGGKGRVRGRGGHAGRDALRRMRGRSGDQSRRRPPPAGIFQRQHGCSPPLQYSITVINVQWRCERRV